MTDTTDGQKKRSFAPLFIGLVPLLIFCGLAVGFGYQLLFGNDPRIVPSAFIGEPVPEVVLPPLKSNKPGFGPEDLKTGEPVLVNVFASWCGPCRVEHPLITALARDHDITVYGFNSKDTRTAAIQWLNELGDPYEKIGFDPTGRFGIDWGVYGYPETFLVSPEGEIVYKRVGPIHWKLVEEEILPRIAAMRGE